jgi:hypothetical protein
MINEVTWQPGMTLAQIERMVIMKALSWFQGNKEQTARALGVSTKTIYNKVEQYAGRMPLDVTPEDARPEETSVPTQERVRVEPPAKTSKKQSVSMRQRQEV